jgi:hypothetical protein
VLPCTGKVLSFLLGSFPGELLAAVLVKAVLLAAAELDLLLLLGLHGLVVVMLCSSAMLKMA